MNDEMNSIFPPSKNLHPQNNGLQVRMVWETGSREEKCSSFRPLTCTFDVASSCVFIKIDISIEHILQNIAVAGMRK